MTTPEFCQTRNDLLDRWSEAARALSVASLKRFNFPEIEKARLEVRKAHDAFERHDREHGCGRMDHPIVK